MIGAFGANYNNIKEGIYGTTEFLEKFLLGHDDPINDPINDPIKLDEREQQIVELLRKESTLTRSGMAKRLGCSESTVKRTLQSMVEKGVIKRIGSNKKGEWIIL